MAVWRPIDTRVWTDRKFKSLNSDGRVLWLFLLTTSFARMVPGVVVAGEAAIAEELEWKPERLRKAFAELAEKRLSFKRDGKLIWLTNAFKYQKIAGPKAIIGMGKIWDDIPECALKAEVFSALTEACASWDKVFGEVFAKHIASTSAYSMERGIGNGIDSPIDSSTDSPSTYGFIQEQDQEQDQEQEQEKLRSAPLAPPTQLEFLKRKVDKAESEHHRAIFAFDSYYQRTHAGAKPTWQGKNAKLIAGLVKAHGADEIARRIGVLEAAPPRFPPAPWDLPTFVQHFDKVSVAV